MNKAAVTQAQLKRAFAVAVDLGCRVAGIRCHPDGSTDLLFGEPLVAEEVLTEASAERPPAPDPEDGGWEAHEKRHGYG